MCLVLAMALLGSCLAYPMETANQRRSHPSIARDAGFMARMDFDGFIQDARLPGRLEMLSSCGG